MNPIGIPDKKPGSNLDTRVVQLIVAGGGVLTPTQRAGVEAAYQLHLANVQTSAAGFLIRDTQLADGSPVRLVSNSGLHTIVVTPVRPEGERVALPHGFAVNTNWHAPVIYGWKADPGGWHFYGDPPVLQLRPDVPFGYNQVVRNDSHPVVLPMVYDDTQSKLWDYAEHKAKRDYTGTYVVPVNSSFEVEGHTLFYPHKYHMAVDGKIKGMDNAAFYTMAPGAQIDGEGPTPLPGNTDSNGNFVVLQAYRVAGIVESNPDIQLYRLWSEVLQRVGPASYALSARKNVEIQVPLGGSQTTTDVSEDFGVTITGLYSTLYNAGDAGAVLDPGTDPTIPHGHTVLYFVTIDNNTYALAALTGSTYHRVTTATADPSYTIADVIALPSQGSVGYASLEVDFTYPATKNFRGGFVQKMYNISFLPSGYRGHGKYRIRKDRADSQHSMSGAPVATLHLGWTDVKVVEGVCEGILVGKHYFDTEDTFKSSAEITNWEYMVADGPMPGVGVSVVDKWNDMQARGNMAPLILSAWAAAAPNGTTITTIDHQDVANHGSYTLTSRHIIDYDNRAGFYAAIKAVVACSGAAWKQVPGSYFGDLIVDTDPSYEVSISFESNWNGTVREQPLVTASGTKPAFEFEKIETLNVYVYPGDDTAYPFTYHMPPKIGLNDKFMDGMLRLASHQGVNPHLAAEDYRPALPEAFDSPDGHELSYLDTTGAGAVEKPHTRRARGQLYARTFTLNDADIRKALWMLTQLTIDAKLNNMPANPAEWYYFPAIRAALATRFHIEIRDGEFVQWSDELPGSESHPRPVAPADREIKLYQV